MSDLFASDLKGFVRLRGSTHFSPPITDPGPIVRDPPSVVFGSPRKTIHVRFTHHEQAFRIVWRPKHRRLSRAVHRARRKLGLSVVFYRR